MNKKIRLFALGLFVLMPLITSAQTEEEKVIHTVQQLLDAIASRDTVKAQSVLLPGGQFFSIREDSSVIRIRKRSHTEFKTGLTKASDEMREVILEPIVLIHNRVAILWSNYDFFLRGNFSHRGVDAFSLLKTDNGWKIAGLIYSVE